MPMDYRNPSTDSQNSESETIYSIYAFWVILLPICGAVFLFCCVVFCCVTRAIKTICRSNKRERVRNQALLNVEHNTIEPGQEEYTQESERSVIERIRNQPAKITWIVTCQRHSNMENNYKKYMETCQCRNNEGFYRANVSRTSLSSTLSNHYKYLKLIVHVKHTFPSDDDLPLELKQKEQEIRQQHAQCPNFSLKRKTDTVHHIIVRNQNWTGQIQCGTVEVEYTVEKLYRTFCNETPVESSDVAEMDHTRLTTTITTIPATRTQATTRTVPATNTRTLQATTRTRTATTTETANEPEDPPPSYHTFLANQDTYKHPDQQLPTYEQYIKLYSKKGDDTAGETASAVSYDLEATNMQVSSSSVEDELPMNVTQLGSAPSRFTAQSSEPTQDSPSTLAADGMTTESLFTIPESSNFGLRRYQTGQELTPNPIDGWTRVSVY